MRYGILTVTALLGCTSPAHGGDNMATSWRKPNNSFENFKQDAVECAKIGYFRDVSGDAPAKAFLRGFQTADDELNDPGGANVDIWLQTILRTQPLRKMKAVQLIQLSDVESCLTDKGYTKFALDKSEAKQLNLLDRGSEARKRYLYDLSVKTD